MNDIPDPATGPQSLCICGHTGDGAESEHETIVAPGHGACTKCECPKFTWDRFLSRALHPEEEAEDDIRQREEDEEYHGSEAEKGDIPNPATGSID